MKHVFPLLYRPLEVLCCVKMKYLAIVRFIAAIKEKQYCHASVLIVANGNYSCKVKSVNCWQGGPSCCYQDLKLNIAMAK